MNETALQGWTRLLAESETRHLDGFGKCDFFFYALMEPFWEPESPTGFAGKFLGEAIGAWIDDSEHEIFTMNYANYVFLAVESLLSQRTCLFAVGGMQEGCFETCFSLETGREQWHPTDWIYRYLSSICSMETEPGPQTDFFFWRVLGDILSWLKGKKPYTHWI